MGETVYKIYWHHKILLTCLDSPSLKDWHARCKAYRLEEQAVSMVKLGPRRSKNQDTRFDNIALPVPVAALGA